MNFYKRSFNIYGFFKFYLFKLLKIKTAKFNTSIGTMYLDVTNDGISKSYAYWGLREHDKHELISENVKIDDYVIDCGSNIGGYAKFMDNIIGKNGKIICIEPDKRNYFVLILIVSSPTTITRLIIKFPEVNKICWSVVIGQVVEK